MEKSVPSDTLPEDFRSGFVTLIGRPNAGKSTLINTIIGKKIAITSGTPQTTRNRFRAVLTRENFQMIIVDTPGLHKPKDNLSQTLNAAALKALNDVDVVAMLVDSSQAVGSGDEWVVDRIKDLSAKKICVLSKTDLASCDEIDAQTQAIEKLLSWDAVVRLSSKTGQGVEDFIESVVRFLPTGPAWFPEDMETDQPVEVMVAEFIREKILRSLFDELPHSSGVVVENMETVGKGKKTHVHIEAIIYVEHKSQVGIVVGKNGQKIKEIATEARIDLEHLLGTKVYLEILVKVKKNWRKDPAQIRRFGYGEDLSF